MHDWLALVINKLIAWEEVAESLVGVHVWKAEDGLALTSNFIELEASGESLVGFLAYVKVVNLVWCSFDFLVCRYNIFLGIDSGLAESIFWKHGLWIVIKLIIDILKALEFSYFFIGLLFICANKLCNVL